MDNIQLPQQQLDDPNAYADQQATLIQSGIASQSYQEMNELQTLQVKHDHINLVLTEAQPDSSDFAQPETHPISPPRMVPSPRPHRTNKDQEKLDELLSSHEFYQSLNQNERQLLIDSLGFVTVPTGNALYPEESQDEEDEEEKPTYDAFILFRGSLSSGDAEYKQQGQIITQGNMVSLEDSSVWRIRGDVIDRLGLKDKLYPRFHTDLGLGDHEEQKLDVHDPVPDAMAGEPQLQPALDLDALMESSSLHFDNPLSLDDSRQDSLVMFHQPDAAGFSAYNSLVRTSISALPGPGLGHQQLEHLQETEQEYSLKENEDAHSNLEGAIGAYFDRQYSQRVLLDYHNGAESDKVGPEDEGIQSLQENHDRLEQNQAHDCQPDQHEQPLDHYEQPLDHHESSQFNHSEPSPLQDSPLIQEDPQAPLQPLAMEDMSHLQPINADFIYPAAHHQDHLSNEELKQEIDHLTTEEDKHDHEACEHVSQEVYEHIQIASDVRIPEQEAAEQQAIPSREVEDIEETAEVQDQEHEQSDESLNQKMDHHVEDKHHIEDESHGIHQQQEPRVDNDEANIEEPEAHQLMREEPITQAYDLPQAYDLSHGDSDQHPDQDLSVEIDTLTQFGRQQSHIVEEEVKLERGFSNHPDNQTGQTCEEAPFPYMDADEAFLHHQDGSQHQAEQPALHKSDVSNIPDYFENNPIQQEAFIQEEEYKNQVEPKENNHEKVDVENNSIQNQADNLHQFQLGDGSLEEIIVDTDAQKDSQPVEHENAIEEEEEAKEAHIQCNSEEGIVEEFKTSVTEPLPEETEQTPHDTMAAHNEQQKVDEVHNQDPDYQFGQSDSYHDENQEFEHSHNMQLPQQSHFDDDHYRISDEGDTHLNFQSQTAVIHSEVDDFHHVPIDQETKRMSISMQNNQTPLNRSQFITSDYDRDSPEKNQLPINQEDRLQENSTLEVDFALHQTNLNQLIVIKHEGSTQTDSFHSRDQEVQVLQSVHHEVSTQVEQVVSQEQAAQTDSIADPLKAETIEQMTQTEQHAETTASKHISKIQEYLEVMGSTQTDSVNLRDQEVQVLQSVYNEVWTQVEQVVSYQEQAVQNDQIAESIPAETSEQIIQTDKPAETLASKLISKIQGQLEDIPEEEQTSLIFKLQNTLELFVQLTHFRQHVNHEQLLPEQAAPSSLTISSQKQSALAKSLLSENQLQEKKSSPQRSDLTQEALRLKQLLDTTQTSLASDYALIISVLAIEKQPIEPVQTHTDLITVVRPKRMAAAQAGLKSKVSPQQEEKKEKEFKARVEQQYHKLIRYISEDSQQDVALEKSAMFIFVAQQILAKAPKTLQTFDQLKTLLGSLSQEEAVTRILQVKAQGFTLRAELRDKLIDLYACLKKDSNIVFYVIISEEIGPMDKVPKEKREEPMGMQVVRKKRVAVNAGIQDAGMGVNELGPIEKMNEVEIPENSTGSVLFVEKRRSTPILNEYGSIVDIPLSQDLLRTDQQQPIDYSEAPILNVQSSSSGVVVDHLKTSLKKGAADRKLKDYLSRNNKKGNALQSEPQFQTINQEGSKTLFNHTFSEDGEQLMMTGDFRKSYDIPKKHSSPGKRWTTGVSPHKRQSAQSPGRFGGSQYQKAESIDGNTAGHSRNESKSNNVFNSKVSEALRSGGGFSSNRGLATPVGFNLTQNTGSSTMSNQRVLDRLRGKIAMKLSEKIPFLSYGSILTALKESSVDDYIKKLLLSDKLQIVDQTNAVVLDKEVKEELGIMKMSNYKSPTRKGLTVKDPTAVIKISDISSKAKTSLKISDKNMKALEQKIREYFKTPKVPVMIGQATLTQTPLTARR